MSTRGLTVSIVSAVLLTVIPFGSSANTEPAYSVSTAALAAALKCPASFSHPEREPVLLVQGTGVTPEEHWKWNYHKVLTELGFDVCTVRFPNRALNDIQIATEYFVYAIRYIYDVTDELKVDVLGHSQGGLEPRWALKWWPSLQIRIDDLVTLASPHHGTYVADLCRFSCLPAVWQMRRASNFLNALNAVDETPGEVSYTSIYSLTDELVQPSVAIPGEADSPTALLNGATNILVQDVCPGRPVDHFGFAVDAVAFELVIDAFTNAGTADVSRIDSEVCNATWFEGVDWEGFGETIYNSFATQDGFQFNTTPSEPPLKPYAQGN